MTPERSADVSITPLPSPTLTQHTYRVVCQVLGIQKVTFSVGNGPTSKNPMPANESSSIRSAVHDTAFQEAVALYFTYTLHCTCICF